MLSALLLLATTTRGSLVAKDRDHYQKYWARSRDKGRCDAKHCKWIGGFDTIDVDCRIVIERDGLASGGRGPMLSLLWNNGRRKLSIDAQDASAIKQFETRPALCEYTASRNTTSEVALLMVANEPSYLFRMWGPFLNKLLYAIDAGLRPMLWLGDLPERLRTPTSEQCLNSSEMRYLADRGGAQARQARKCSHRYLKIPATIAALAAPDIRGVYYVGMDAVARFPWSVDPNTLSEHTRRSSDVSFLVAHDGGLRWQVKGSRFYVRDAAKGRAFFANWFENRCTADDKYALWHTMLESAASEGCVPYSDEIFRMRYSEAKHLKADEAPAALLLDCRTIDAACPSFSFSSTGGHAACNNTPPDLLDDLRLQGSGRDGRLRLWLDEYALTVENTCFATDDGRCEYASDVSEFAALLGVAGRDRSLHPWNSTAASAPWEPIPVGPLAAFTGGGCKDFQATPKFSLAGNCGAPERLNASLTDKLYFFSWVSSHDGELLRHFLDFYTARGIRFKEPGWARLVVSPFRESRRELLDEFVHPNNIRYEPDYSSDRKKHAVNAYLRTLPAGHFLMYPDLDEFFDIPSAKLDEAIVHGSGFVLGTMVDRVAYDWTLPSMTEGPLWSQFPPVWKSKFYGSFVLNHRVVLHAIDATPARWRGDAGSSPLDRARFPRRCFATHKLFNALTKKWLLVPTYIPGFNRTLQYASSHRLKGEDLVDRLKGAKLRCYGFSHYRFGAKSVKLLRDKLDVYRHGPAHKIYGRISGYLVDGTPEEFSKPFQQSVECLESCPASPPRRALASPPEPAERSPQDEYARTWARGGDVTRCGAPNCDWMRGFGPIDVSCRLEIDNIGLANGGAGPKFSLVFNDGRKKTVHAADAKNVHQFVTRPALCEYVPRNSTSSEVALLLVANSPSYLFRLWPMFLNKLLYAIDVGLRPMLWLGEVPEALRKPSSQACLNSKEMECIRKGHHGPSRRFLRSMHVDQGRADSCSDHYMKREHRRLGGASFYDGHRASATECSNHYIKMPATLAALGHPDIKGLYYVDLDTVARAPWPAKVDLSEHKHNFSDVSFRRNSGPMLWKVTGSRYYVRDSPKGRAFFASWFANRCTFKDQYSLWHTILEFAASESCLDYRGEIYRMRYWAAKWATESPPVMLDCKAIDARCPGFKFSNTGGMKCEPSYAKISHLMDDVYHHSVTKLKGDGIFHVTLDDGSSLTVERACLPQGHDTATTTSCDVAHDMGAYLKALGLADRNRAVHPWGEAEDWHVEPLPEPVRPFAWRPDEPVPTRGVLLYVSGSMAFKYAAAATASIRRTDPALAILVASTLDEYYIGHFPRERYSNDTNFWLVDAGHINADLASVRRGRLEALKRSPFAETIYVDNDSVSCRSLEQIFDECANHTQWAFTLRAASHHDALRALNQFEGSPWTLPPPNAPYANAALLFYRPFEPEVVELLHHWTEAYRYGAAHGNAYDHAALWVATAQVETLRTRVFHPWYSCGFRDDHEATCETMRHRERTPDNFRTVHRRSASKCFLLHGRNVRSFTNETEDRSHWEWRTATERLHELVLYRAEGNEALLPRRRLAVAIFDDDDYRAAPSTPPRAAPAATAPASPATQTIPFPWEGPTTRGVLIYAVGQKYLTTAKRLVDSIRVHDTALPILVAHASGVDTKDGALYFGGDDPQTRLVAVPNPANEGRTERDRAGASHRAMGALRRGRFDVLGRSPFRTTLYVDADALACRSLESIFEAVEQNRSQWAFCEKNNHFHKRRDGSRYHEPRDERHAVALFRGFPDLAMPDLTSPFANAGFIVYRPFDEEVQELLRNWRRVYDLGYAKKVSVDQPSLWIAQRNTPGLRIQVLDVTMSCRVHDSFSKCGRFSARPANFVTEHTRRAKACVLIHGHNLSAAPAQRPHRSGQMSPAG